MQKGSAEWFRLFAECCEVIASWAYAETGNEVLREAWIFEMRRAKQEEAEQRQREARTSERLNAIINPRARGIAQYMV